MTAGLRIAAAVTPSAGIIAWFSFSFQSFRQLSAGIIPAGQHFRKTGALLRAGIARFLSLPSFEFFVVIPRDIVYDVFTGKERISGSADKTE